MLIDGAARRLVIVTAPQAGADRRRPAGRLTDNADLPHVQWGIGAAAAVAVMHRRETRGLWTSPIGCPQRGLRFGGAVVPVQLPFRMPAGRPAAPCHQGGLASAALPRLRIRQPPVTAIASTSIRYPGDRRSTPISESAGL